MKPFPTTQAHFSRTHLEDDRALWSTSTQPLEFLFVADKAVKDTLPLLTALPDIQHAAAKENRRPSHFLFWSYHAKPIWFSAGSCCVRSVWPWEAAVEWGQMASYHWGKATGKCTSALPTPGTCCMETGCRWVYRTEGCPQAVKDDLQQETAPLRKEMFRNALRQDASSCNICQRFWFHILTGIRRGQTPWGVCCDFLQGGLWNIHFIHIIHRYTSPAGTTNSQDSYVAKI